MVIVTVGISDIWDIVLQLSISIFQKKTVEQLLFVWPEKYEQCIQVDRLLVAQNISQLTFHLEAPP